MSFPIIQFYNVSKVYTNGIVALSNISLSILSGEFVFVIGPAGAGKTTLVKLIYAEEKPTSGEVLVDGRDVSKLKKWEIAFLRRNIGVVFQDFKLIRDRTVFENVAFALRVCGFSENFVKKATEDALGRVDLLHKRGMYPDQLSGGEQQRVAIARAIVNKPSILLTDEPTGNLDPYVSEEILQLFEDLNKEGTTVVMVTHNAGIVNSRDYRVIALQDGIKTRDDGKGGYRYV